MSVPPIVELCLCAAIGPTFSLFWILQIRSEKYTRPACRKTAQSVHRWMLAASLLIASEIPLLYLYIGNKTRFLISLLRLVNYLIASMYFSCLAMVCYWIVRAFYKSLMAHLPRFTKRLFYSLCVFSIITALAAPLCGYYLDLRWPYIMPGLANDILILLLLLLLTRYWYLAKRLITDVYAPSDKHILEVPRSSSEEEIFKHVGMAAVEDDHQDQETNVPILTDKESGEERVLWQLRKLGYFILWVAMSMFPVLLLTTLRSLDMLKAEYAVEKSDYSFYLIVLGAGILSFCAWYAWIPIVWHTSPAVAPVSNLVSSTSIPAHAPGGIDLSYRSLDMTGPPTSSSFSDNTPSPRSTSYLIPTIIPTLSTTNSNQ